MQSKLPARVWYCTMHSVLMDLNVASKCLKYIPNQLTSSVIVLLLIVKSWRKTEVNFNKTLLIHVSPFKLNGLFFKNFLLHHYTRTTAVTGEVLCLFQQSSLLRYVQI